MRLATGLWRAEHLPNRTVAHGDYVMTVDGYSYPMAASCWLGGERGKGCAAFTDSAHYIPPSAHPNRIIAKL